MINLLLVIIFFSFFTNAFSQSEIKIGEFVPYQIWMVKNLDVSTFRNGDPIPEAKTEQEWINAGLNGKPAWCFYDNKPTLNSKYGKLYNWFAVNDPRGLAPVGWHIATYKEFRKLSEYLGGEGQAAKKMRDNTLWRGGYGDNESGFTALPSGYRTIQDGVCKFVDLGYSAFFWSATTYREGEDLSNENRFVQRQIQSGAWRFSIDYNNDNLSKTIDDKARGNSVRCIKD